MVGRTPELDRPTKRLGYVLEALVVYPLFWLIGCLPLETASTIGGFLGRTLGYRSGITKRARTNLARIMPDLSEDRREDILIGMWDNIGRTVFEFPNLHKMRFDGPDPHIQMENTEVLLSARDDGKPGIFYGGHFANWEVQALSAWHSGIDLQLIYRAPNNPLVDRLFKKRLKNPDAVVPKGNDGARHTVKVLRQGGHLGMLVDQKMNDGIAVPFLGVDAMTAPALAIMAMKFKCVVIPSQVKRLGGPRFKVTFGEPKVYEPSDDREAAMVAIMTEVNDNLSAWVRENPEQWLWIHNRWPKTD